MSKDKMPEKIVTSIYLTKGKLDAIGKMADRCGIARTEQIRRFIDKGLSIESYEESGHGGQGRCVPCRF